MNTQPPAKEMESLSLTAQPTGTQLASATSPPVSPRASAPSSPASRPGPGDSDTAVDEKLPPYFWKPAETPEGREEQDRLFIEYYKKRGFVYDEEKKVFLPRAHNYWTEYNGETILRSKRVQEGSFGADTYDEDFVTYMAPASALPELNEKRLKDLAEAREKLARAQQAPDGPDKAKTVRGLEKEVRLLVNPLEQWVPTIMDEESDTREVEEPRDIYGNDASEETMLRFGHILERMSAVGALGTVEVPGPDGKMVKQNRKWANGEVWRPKSESKDWEAWAGDEPPTSTFHGFIPRHPRPDGIGFGHLGYDSVYTRSRDGVGYTSEDVPDQVWDQPLDAPIVLETRDGEQWIIDRPLEKDNPVFGGRDPSKPLSQILAEEEAAHAEKAAHQGGVGRGSGRGAGGQGAQASPGEGWH